MPGRGRSGRDQLVPWERVLVAVHHLERPVVAVVGVIGVAVDEDVLRRDVAVDVDQDVTGIGKVAGFKVSAAPTHIEPDANRLRLPDVSTTTSAPMPSVSSRTASTIPCRSFR